MIKGFEELTKALTADEIKAVDVVAAILKECKGKENARTGANIAENVYLRLRIQLDGARLRKVINYIRLTGMVEMVAAYSHGYYLAETMEEAAEYLKSLRDRTVAIRATLTAFSDQCATREIFNYKLFEEEAK